MSKKQSGIAIYRQLADILTLRIKQGKYQAGEQLPSDRDLSDELGHNRHTIRRALDILEGNKLIIRHQGRGTFVVDNLDMADNRTSLTLGLIDLAREIGERPIAKVLSRHRQAAAQINKNRSVPLEGNYYVIHRLRSVDGDPLIIETIHIPDEIVPNLLTHDLTESLRELLQDTYNIQIVRVDISIESIVSDGYMSKLLKIPIGSPLILEKRHAYTVNENICEYSEHIYRGDRFTFSQKFHQKVNPESE